MIIILSIITVVSLPDLAKLVHVNKIKAVQGELLSALNFTRTLAISKGKRITLCNKKPYANKCDGGKTWRYGWLVYNDSNGDRQVNHNEDLVLVHSNSKKDVFIRFNKSYIRYGKLGFAYGYAGTFTLCRQNNAMLGRSIIIGFNGRIRSSDTHKKQRCVIK